MRPKGYLVIVWHNAVVRNTLDVSSYAMHYSLWDSEFRIIIAFVGLSRIRTVPSLISLSVFGLTVIIIVASTISKLQLENFLSRTS